MKKILKICECCFAESLMYHNAKFCKACAKKQAERRNKQYKEEARILADVQYRMSKYHSKALINDAVEATKRHLSYGEYMALKMRGKLN